MTDAPPMAFKATFAKINPIMTREVVQFIFEVPTDQADNALKLLGGMPRSRDERWCAIARLDDTLLSKSNAEHVKDAMSHPPLDLNERITRRRQFCDLPFPQQAGILTKDADFQIWLCGITSEWDAAAEIRKRCGVGSRADIWPGTTAGEKWISLLREYEGVR